MARARRFAVWWVAGLVLAAAGCSGRLPAWALAPTLSYRGFSAARPPNGSWYAMRGEQSPTRLLFRRETGSESHGFFFAVDLVALEPPPGSDAEFLRIAEARLGALADPLRYRILAREVVPSERQGAACLGYRLESIDRYHPLFAGGELRSIQKGEFCRHPLWPEAALHLRYSERGLAGELDPALRAEGEALLSGVVIEVAPGVPAGG